jgi:hypothetical protein
MPHRSGDIDVRVNQQILWVGGEAYPLRNIARAQVVRLKINRVAAFWRFVGITLLWLILGLGGSYASRAAQEQGVSLPENIGQIVLVAMAVLLAFSTFRLLYLLLQPTLYALVIETAGNPHTALVTRDHATVSRLVQDIMAAINNPRVQFHRVVNNVHIGDRYGGDRVAGDKVSGNKISY